MPQRAARAPWSDAEVRAAVRRELEWDPRVEHEEIRVEVEGRVVSLSGTVSGWAKRMAAQEAAHRVRGVLDVVNDIEVEIPESQRRTDAEIAHAVRHAVEWDTLVPDSRIRSTVTDGWVRLEGEVERWSEAEDAERAVRNLAGVRGVTNAIEVVPPNDPPEVVKRAIEDALDRRAEQAAGRIRVAVERGTVTLSGEVTSWAQRQAAVAAARRTPGVRDVVDRLRTVPC